MVSAKKLAVAPIFLIVFAYFLYILKPLLNSADLAIGISPNAIVESIILSSLILISSFLFILFATLCQDWKIIIAVALIGALLPLFFFAPPFSYIIVVGFFASLCISNIYLKNKLANYLNFQPVAITLSPVKNLATLLVVVISINYFLVLDGQINRQGFQIPDSLIDTAMQLVPQISDQTDQTSLTNFKLPPEQCAILQKNPELLRKQLPDPSMLDLIDPKTCQINPQKAQEPNSAIRTAIKAQFQQSLAPYKPYIAPVLALLLATSLGFFNWILSYILALIIWITFWILTKTGFIKFEKEMREVKKLVV